MYWESRDLAARTFFQGHGNHVGRFMRMGCTGMLLQVQHTWAGKRILRLPGAFFTLVFEDDDEGCEMLDQEQARAEIWEAL